MVHMKSRHLSGQRIFGRRRRRQQGGDRVSTAVVGGCTVGGSPFLTRDDGQAAFHSRASPQSSVRLFAQRFQVVLRNRLLRDGSESEEGNGSRDSNAIRKRTRGRMTSALHRCLASSSRPTCA